MTTELPEELQENIRNVITKYPPAKPVFDLVVRFFSEQKTKKSSSFSVSAILDKIGQDLSFFLPLRKKMSFNIHESVLSLGNSKDDIEAVLPLDQISYIFCLPTPLKSGPHYSIILFKTVADDYCSAPESIAFGFEDKEPNTKDFILNKLLSIPILTKKQVFQPSINVFQSSKSRANKPVFYVDAMLKNKEG
jgi:hypothetical protein